MTSPPSSFVTFADTPDHVGRLDVNKLDVSTATGFQSLGTWRDTASASIAPDSVVPDGGSPPFGSWFVVEQLTTDADPMVTTVPASGSAGSVAVVALQDYTIGCDWVTGNDDNDFRMGILWRNSINVQVGESWGPYVEAGEPIDTQRPYTFTATAPAGATQAFAMIGTRSASALAGFPGRRVWAKDLWLSDVGVTRFVPPVRVRDAFAVEFRAAAQWATVPANQFFMGNGGDGGATIGVQVQLHAATKQVRLRYRTAGGGDSTATGFAPPGAQDGDWIVVRIERTVDGLIRFLFDGVEAGTVSRFTGEQVWDGQVDVPLIAGGRNPANTLPFVGDLEWLRLRDGIDDNAPTVAQFIADDVPVG